MPRRNRTRATDVRPLPRDGAVYFGTREIENEWGEVMVMRQMGATAAKKFYICPGCNQNIPPGVAHTVAWPKGREDDRRHWHKPCWERENRR